MTPYTTSFGEAASSSLRVIKQPYKPSPKVLSLLDSASQGSARGTAAVCVVISVCPRGLLAQSLAFSTSWVPRQARKTRAEPDDSKILQCGGGLVFHAAVRYLLGGTFLFHGVPTLQ